MITGALKCLEDGLLEETYNTKDQSWESDLDPASCFTQEYELISRMSIWNTPPESINNLKRELQFKAPLLYQYVEKRIACQGGHSTEALNWTPQDKELWNLLTNKEYRTQHPSLQIAHTILTAISGAAYDFTTLFTEEKSERIGTPYPWKEFYTKEEGESWIKEHKIPKNRDDRMDDDQSITITTAEWEQLDGLDIQTIYRDDYKYKKWWKEPELIYTVEYENIELWSHIFQGARDQYHINHPPKK